MLSAHGTDYQLSGPEAAPAIVLIHGLGLTKATFDGMLPALATRYRVLRYDLHGHGQSDPPPGVASLTLYSDQLRRLLDDLGIPKAALVGFSLGGMINRRFAMDHPDRVSALAILNAPHERGAEAQARVEAQAAEAGAGGPGATLDAALGRWFTPDAFATQADLVDRVRSWVLANDPQEYAAARRVLAHGVLELIRPTPPMDVPTLVMTCEDDSGSTPAMSRAIASEIAGAETKILPALRHLGLMENPGAFTRPVLEFLDRL